MITREVRKCGHRVGFSVVDVADGQERMLAYTHHRNGPRVGRYTVDVEALEAFGVAAIRHAIRHYDIVVIDEIAPMELSGPGFAPAVEEALASDCGLVISTHAHSDHPLAHRVRRDLELFRVKVSNRDHLLAEMLAAFEVRA